MTDEEFLALEREGWNGLSSSRGAGYYRGHRSEDALMAFPFGVVDRTQAIDAIASAQPWSRHEITSPRVVRFGEDATVVVYSVSAQREGEPTFNAVVSSTFVCRGSDWQLASTSSRPLTDRKAIVCGERRRRRARG